MKRCRECKPHLLKEKIGHHIFGIRRQAINLHDLTVLIEETGAYPTAVLCRIERFLADLQFAAARSLVPHVLRQQDNPCNCDTRCPNQFLPSNCLSICIDRRNCLPTETVPTFLPAVRCRQLPALGYPKRRPKDNSAHTRLFPAMRRFFHSVWQTCSTRSRAFFPLY